jgi:NAD-dependent deacetylase
MHGELLSKFCIFCNQISRIEEELGKDMPCEFCGKVGGLRPDIVWFGEMPCEMERIYQELLQCDLFVSIGTSGSVYPAAGFVEIANQARARTVELNLEPGEQKSHFQESIYGKASEIVPEFFSK